MEDIFYFRNIVDRWKKEIKASSDVTILTPYISSDTAEAVLIANKPERCTVYTKFSAEVFATGASSVQTLKNLHKAGCKLYSLDKIHAKVVLLDEFVSIGSQNLTHKGENNLEASVAFDGSDKARCSRLEIEKWIRNRKEITSEMLDDMENLVAPIEIKYDEIKKECQKADLEVEINRKEKERKIIEFRIQQAKEKIRNISNPLLAEIKKVSSGWYSSTNSLVPSYYQSRQEIFTEWNIKGESIKLERALRYVLIDVKSCKIGWARVSKTRITFFHHGVGDKGPIYWPIYAYDFPLFLSFNGNWEDPHSGQNLKITIESKKQIFQLVYYASFDLESLLNVQLSEDESTGIKRAQETLDWIELNEERFNRVLVNNFLSPFKYQKKLVGVMADNFFNDYQYRINISLAKIGEYPVLLTERLI
jgi:hypothetical protein